MPCFHQTFFCKFLWFLWSEIYRKVASSRLSRLVAHLRIFRLLMKGKFDAYVLWPLAKWVQNWIVDRSTARDFTVYPNQNQCKNIFFKSKLWSCRNFSKRRNKERWWRCLVVPLTTILYSTQLPSNARRQGKLLMTLNTIAEAVAVLKGNLEIEKLAEAATGSF